MTTAQLHWTERHVRARHLPSEVLLDRIAIFMDSLEESHIPDEGRQEAVIALEELSRRLRR